MQNTPQPQPQMVAPTTQNTQNIKQCTVYAVALGNSKHFLVVPHSLPKQARTALRKMFVQQHTGVYLSTKQNGSVNLQIGTPLLQQTFSSFSQAILQMGKTNITSIHIGVLA